MGFTTVVCGGKPGNRRTAARGRPADQTGIGTDGLWLRTGLPGEIHCAGGGSRGTGGGGDGCPAGCLSHVEEGLAGEFGDRGVGVTEELNERSNPAQLVGINADHGNILGHGNLQESFRPRRRILQENAGLQLLPCAPIS